MMGRFFSLFSGFTFRGVPGKARPVDGLFTPAHAAGRVVFSGAVFRGAQAARGLRSRWLLVQRCARPFLSVVQAPHVVSPPPAKWLRAPWALVQRCARPGSSPMVLSCGTGGAQRTTSERLRVQPQWRLNALKKQPLERPEKAQRCARPIPDLFPPALLPFKTTAGVAALVTSLPKVIRAVFYKLTRGRAVRSARLVHTQKVVGSNPAPATTTLITSRRGYGPAGAECVGLGGDDARACGGLFFDVQAPLRLRPPWGLVQRFARPGSSPTDLSCGTGRPKGGLASKAERSPFAEGGETECGA